MKYQDLEFLHQKMVSQQMFAVPSNDFSSIVECVMSRTKEPKLLRFHICFSTIQKIPKSRMSKLKVIDDRKSWIK